MVSIRRSPDRSDTGGDAGPGALAGLRSRPFVARAILFDLDGTLIDSAPDLQAALNRLLMAMGRSPLSLEVVKSLIGEGVARLVEKAVAATGPAATPEALPDLVQRFNRLYVGSHTVQRTTVYPGVIETLTELRARGLSLGLCTNKPFRAATEILTALKLATYFTEVVGGDTLPERKPDPAPLRHLAAKLGVEPGACLMVGDSAIDVAAARAAEMPVVVLGWGYSTRPPEHLGADRMIATMAELPGALATFERQGVPTEFERAAGPTLARVEAALGAARAPVDAVAKWIRGF